MIAHVVGTGPCVGLPWACFRLVGQSVNARSRCDVSNMQPCSLVLVAAAEEKVAYSTTYFLYVVGAPMPPTRPLTAGPIYISIARF